MARAKLNTISSGQQSFGPFDSTAADPKPRRTNETKEAEAAYSHTLFT